MTSQFDEPFYPTEVLVRHPEGGITINSVILLNHIRSVDQQRLVKRLGRVTRETVRQVDQALLLSLGLLEF